jgi:transcriptional regulator GlxA family with amidase domain
MARPVGSNHATAVIGAIAPAPGEAEGGAMRVGILVFEGVDLLDAGGPYEVFLTASRLVGRDGGDPPFDVVTVSADGEPVTAYGGLGLVPQAAAGEVGPLDVLVVPGTIDVDAATADARLVAAIEALDAGAGLTTSVCTGAFLLARAGLLDGRPWTTHWEDVDDLAARLSPDGAAGATRGVRWVDGGRVVTSGGLSSGIAMALHVVDRLAGRELAVRTARQLDYSWSPEPDGAAGAEAGTRRASPGAGW